MALIPAVTHSAPRPPNLELAVRPASSREHVIAISHIARGWADLAREKYLRHHGVSIAQQREANPEVPIASVLASSANICMSIYNSLKDGRGTPNNVLVCTDATGEIQAIATTEDGDTQFELHFLATHPDNLPHPVNDTAQKVHGAGTAIIRHLGLRLPPTSRLVTSVIDDSFAFYDKLHFDLISPDSLYGRELTAEKVRRLVASGTPPFSAVEVEIYGREN